MIIVRKYYVFKVKLIVAFLRIIMTLASDENEMSAEYLTEVK